ncbi:MAG: hypothetical protein HN909_08415 [Phycisphaerales bacterium]|nr:hypothetical protein [Phycisphaerales bacterium]MBT7171777.1 hypothetical protein [Phycisphaerales bacterium]
MITLIVAMDEGHLIGRGNELPWHLSGDLRRFRQITMGGVLIMGRKTWQSLPGSKPYLDGRINCVITRDPAKYESSTDGCDEECGPFFFDSIEAAVAFSRETIQKMTREIFIMGGREIYAMALASGVVDRMLITHVKGTHDGDVYFPEIGDEWVGRLDYEDKREGLFEVLDYVRRPKEL